MLECVGFFFVDGSKQDAPFSNLPKRWSSYVSLVFFFILSLFLSCLSPSVLFTVPLFSFHFSTIYIHKSGEFELAGAFEDLKMKMHANVHILHVYYDYSIRSVRHCFRLSFSSCTHFLVGTCASAFNAPHFLFVCCNIIARYKGRVPMFKASTHKL